MNAEMVECQDCKHKVSKSAEWCPACGSKLKDSYIERLARRQMIASRVVMTIFVLLVGGCAALTIF